ncbi:MAG: YeeE/YedE thiosulfate transporter family protein [bacterium]|nr:YeeE/YedE thiosulfate transporter family protein [bacterium]
MKNKWLVQALVLGISFFVAIYLMQPIGVSTQFNVLDGIIQSTVDQDLITENPDRSTGYESTNAYYDLHDGKLAKQIKEPINYSFVFVLAIPFGAAIGRLLNKRRRNQAFVDNPIDDYPLEGNLITRYARSFIAGFLLLFGARMAGGCTSGHMMSGMMQGSVSGFLFAAAVFIVAIPVAIFTDKNRKRQ